MKTTSHAPSHAPNHAVNQQKPDMPRNTSAATVVFEALQRAIVEGTLEDGTPLRQDDLARQFNTSRIPVREAISRLEEQGLAKSVRFKGAVVAGLDAEELGEIYAFRALVEPEVIRHAVPHLTQDDLDEAARYFDLMEGAQEMREWAEHNRAFHAALYEPSGLSYHLDALDRAMNRVHRYLSADFVPIEIATRSNGDHRMIWQACGDGDAARAAELTRAHVAGASELLLERMTRRF